MEIIIITFNNTAEFESGLTQHTRELYDRYPDVRFIEYFACGKYEGIIRNVSRKKINKKIITQLNKLNNRKIFFLTLRREFYKLSETIKNNEVYFIDHGN